MAVKIAQPKNPARYPCASGTKTKLLIRRGDRKTRITFGGRNDGTATLKLKPYLIGDDEKPASLYPDIEFEGVTGGAVDFSSDKLSRYFEGDFIAVLIDDTAYSGSDPSFHVEIHQ
jgi:hypothetical protein